MSAASDPSPSRPFAASLAQAARTSRRSGALGPVLVLATVCMGLIAGLFYTFAIAVMPGLGRTDDRTLVLAMQKINESIQNPAFAPSFFGSFLFTGAAAILQRRLGPSAAFRWIVAALLLYVVAVVITITINIPLNDELADAGHPDRVANLTRVRDNFETPWIAANIARTLVATAAVACLGRALILHGQAEVQAELATDETLEPSSR